jgi:hypothetical protein
MGKLQDETSVVGPDLKAHGYNNLRVADLITVPILPRLVMRTPDYIKYCIGFLTIFGGRTYLDLVLAGHQCPDKSNFRHIARLLHM